MTGVFFILISKEIDMAQNRQRKYVTREQIEQAKQMDLLSYLRAFERDELVRLNECVYTTHVHDSLKISNGKWCWWSQGIGGRSALDYLIKVRGMEFVEAVQHLCGCTGYTPPPPAYTVKPSPKPPFMLPKPHINSDRVLRYLTGRGIDSEILVYCVQTGRLYEDERHNCVFVGFDDERRGQVRHAAQFQPHVDISYARWTAATSGTPLPCRFAMMRIRSICLKAPSTCFRLPHCERKHGSNSITFRCRASTSRDKRSTKRPLPVALAQHLRTIAPMYAALFSVSTTTMREGWPLQTICTLLPERYAAELLLPDKGKDYNRQLQIERGISPAVSMRGEPEIHR